MQGTVFYQVNQEFPQSTCCQEKRKNRADSLSAQLGRVVTLLAGPSGEA